MVAPVPAKATRPSPTLKVVVESTPDRVTPGATRRALMVLVIVASDWVRMTLAVVLPTGISARLV